MPRHRHVHVHLHDAPPSQFRPGQNPASHKAGTGGNGGGVPAGGSPHHHATLTSRGFQLHKPATASTSAVYRHPKGHEVAVDPKSGEYSAYTARAGRRVGARSTVTTSGAVYHAGGKSAASLNKTLSHPHYSK